MLPQLQDALLRLPDVRKATALSRATIYRLEREGNFPARVAIGERSVAWRSSQVSEWIAARTRRPPCLSSSWV